MAESKKAGAALAISIPAAIIGLAALTKKAAAAPPGELVLPKEVIDLFVAIGAAIESIDTNTKNALQALTDLSINVQGWPTNASSITAVRQLVTIAGTRMPDIVVPSGMSLVIKAWTLNPGQLQVGASIAECTNANQSFPLLPNEIVAYQVQNANQIYIAGTVAGCIACLTVEKKGGGG